MPGRYEKASPSAWPPSWDNLSIAPSTLVSCITCRVKGTPSSSESCSFRGEFEQVHTGRPLDSATNFCWLWLYLNCSAACQIWLWQAETWQNWKNMLIKQHNSQIKLSKSLLQSFTVALRSWRFGRCAFDPYKWKWFLPCHLRRGRRWIEVGQFLNTGSVLGQFFLIYGWLSTIFDSLTFWQRNCKAI